MQFKYKKLYIALATGSFGLLSLANVALATTTPTSTPSSAKVQCLRENQQFHINYTNSLKANKKTYSDALKVATDARKDAVKKAEDDYKAAVAAAKTKLTADLGAATTTQAKNAAKQAYKETVKTALTNRKIANENARNAFKTTHETLTQNLKNSNSVAKTTRDGLIKRCN